MNIWIIYQKWVCFLFIYNQVSCILAFCLATLPGMYVFLYMCTCKYIYESVYVSVCVYGWIDGWIDS